MEVNISQDTTGKKSAGVNTVAAGKGAVPKSSTNQGGKQSNSNATKQCHFCKIKGHIQSECRKKSMQRQINQNPNQIVIKNHTAMTVVLNTIQIYSLHRVMGITKHLLGAPTVISRDIWLQTVDLDRKQNITIMVAPGLTGASTASAQATP